MTGGGGLFVGLDLGTSGLKAIALDDRGGVVARSGAGYPTSRPAAHAAEQDPAHWNAAVNQVAAELGEQASPDRWRAIGLSGMIPTLVTAGPDGRPLGPAITWEDSRAEEEGERLRAACGASELYRMTGQIVDGRYLIPMYLRLARAEPDRAAATASILGAKDYLFGELTGQVATDPSTASGFGCYRLLDGEWDEKVRTVAAELAGLGHLPRLPRVRPSTTARPLLPGFAARFGCGEIPVCLGAADSVLGAAGLGISMPGQIGYVAGTSTVILGVTDGLLLDPDRRFLVTPLAEPGLWGLEMDLLATGSSLHWLANLLGEGLTERELIAMADRCDPADAPVTLPFLSPGEQGALWDPLLHGTIAGLTLSHDRRHLARGLVNGILLESRRCLAVLDETAPFSRDLYVAGGSAAEASFRADLADATGRRVIMPAGPDTDFSARGAARIAARATDTASDRASDEAGGADQANGNRPGGPAPLISDPDPARSATWASLWQAHERARLAITGHYHGRGNPERSPLRPWPG